MARKTKEQILQEHIADDLAIQIERASEYKAGLMPLLEKACNYNYEITVKDSQLILNCRDGYDNGYEPSKGYFSFDIKYTDLSYGDYTSLECDLERRQKYEAEQDRRYKAKQVALAKLTQEEKELLNL